ncbi:MAG: SDR family NAD(P)-dependent oxidoreductase [Acidimicrobiales bacterium]
MTELRGARVLITGGAGFIGSTIADQMIEAGAAEIILLDNLVRGTEANVATACESGVARLVVGDIRDRALVEELSAGIDIVFHQAALRITHCAEDPRLGVDVMATGTLNVVQAAVDAGVSKLVAASSASIYGQAPSFPTAESDHGYDNRTLYGAAKMFNEGLLRSYNDMFGLDYVALRYFNVYGPRMDIHGVYTEVLVRWMERIEAGLPPLIFGDGKQTMDFVYISDVARANVLAAASDVTDKVYNVAFGVETSLGELAQALLRVMGSELSPEYGPERKVNPVARRLASTTAAANDLGFKAEVSLHDGLAELVDWWQVARPGNPQSGVPA